MIPKSPLVWWNFPQNCVATFWVMLVIMAQNVKTSTSSNRSDHINRTKSCFPPLSDVTQRSVSHIRLLVDSVRVWVREHEENRRRPLIFWFVCFFFFKYSQLLEPKALFFSNLCVCNEIIFKNYLQCELQLLPARKCHPLSFHLCPFEVLICYFKTCFP